jgi:transglutaminase-like putative cysteine protease
MFYAIRHFTRYRYSQPVRQSLMEVRMHPRSESAQRCFTFQLSVSPRARIFSYTDYHGNLVHHFDMPGQHNQLTIIADALVDVDRPMDLPASLGPDAWDELDRMILTEDYWAMLMPSHFARPSSELKDLARELGVDKRNGRDPLELLSALNSDLYRSFAYVKKPIFGSGVKFCSAEDDSQSPEIAMADDLAEVLFCK